MDSGALRKPLKRWDEKLYARIHAFFGLFLMLKCGWICTDSGWSVSRWVFGSHFCAQSPLWTEPVALFEWQPGSNWLPQPNEDQSPAAEGGACAQQIFPVAVPCSYFPSRFRSSRWGFILPARFGLFCGRTDLQDCTAAAATLWCVCCVYVCVYIRECVRFLEGCIVWEVPSQLLLFLSFSHVIIFFILTTRPHCFALLISLLLSPTVCCSPAERKREYLTTTTNNSHHHHQPPPPAISPFLCCCWILLDYNAEGFILVLICSLMGCIPAFTRWAGRIQTHCAPNELLPFGFWCIWRCSDRGLWSVRIPSGSGYKLKTLPSALSVSLEPFLLLLLFIFSPFSSQCGRLAGLKAHRLTMGDSMWRYYFGVLFIALKVDLCRALILESIYWNTTNTK